jgi:ribose transport system substrate-binding protein
MARAVSPGAWPDAGSLNSKGAAVNTLWLRGSTLALCAAVLAGAGPSVAVAADTMTKEEMVAAAQANLDAYKQIPEFVAPGPAFDARALMKDKHIYQVPYSMAIPFVATVVESMVEQAGRVGVKYDVWSADGTTPSWVQGMQAATAAAPDLIDTFANDPQTFVPQVKAAREAGIQVVDSHAYSSAAGLRFPESEKYLETPASLNELGVLYARSPYYLAGQLEADAAIAGTKGNTDALFVTAKESSWAEAMEAGVRDEFALYCPDCKLKVVNVPTPQWTTGMQTTIQGEVVANPNLNYIMAAVDFMTPGIVAALEATGRQDQVKISTFNGTPAFIDQVREGKLDVDIGESLDWAGHTVLDQNMRAIAGLPAPDDTHAAVRVFDASNAAEAGVPAESNKGFGEAYKPGFDALWMMDQ